MKFETTGTIRGDRIILSENLPIEGKVKLIITREEEKTWNKNLILDYLKSNIENWKKEFSIQKIGLFGSYTRGEEKSVSDIDLLISFSDKNVDVYKNKKRDYLCRAMMNF